jgi:hypothetical protein
MYWRSGEDVRVGLILVPTIVLVGGSGFSLCIAVAVGWAFGVAVFRLFRGPLSGGGGGGSSGPLLFAALLFAPSPAFHIIVIAVATAIALAVSVLLIALFVVPSLLTIPITITIAVAIT